MANAMYNLKKKAIEFSLIGDAQKDALDRLNAKQELKESKREDLKIQKQQEKAFKEEKKVEKVPFKDKMKSIFSKEVEEIEDPYQDITVKNLRDSKFQEFSNSPKGQELLRRNLNTSPLYIFIEGDYLKVQKISRDFEENGRELGTAFIKIETNLDDFILKFKIEEKF